MLRHPSRRRHLHSVGAPLGDVDVARESLTSTPIIHDVGLIKTLFCRHPLSETLKPRSTGGQKILYQGLRTHSSFEKIIEELNVKKKVG